MDETTAGQEPDRVSHDVARNLLQELERHVDLGAIKQRDQLRTLAKTLASRSALASLSFWGTLSPAEQHKAISQLAHAVRVVEHAGSEEIGSDGRLGASQAAVAVLTSLQQQVPIPAAALLERLEQVEQELHDVRVRTEVVSELSRRSREQYDTAAHCETAEAKLRESSDLADALRADIQAEPEAFSTFSWEPPA